MRFSRVVCGVGVALGLLWGGTVWAARTDSRSPVSYICIDGDSGRVISEENADQVRPPASMIKMMMMLLVCEGVRNGDWTLETLVTVGERAEKMGGTQVYVKQDETWPLGHLMQAVAVASANDAAMAVAEGLWGSEEAYKTRMNERAGELGMAHTTFRSVHGLPPEPGEPGDATTARDMALLARACVREPQIMEWVGMKEFQFRPTDAVRYNTNKLLWRLEGCDGMKTGFINDAGFCVTVTVKRGDIRLIMVVMGGPSSGERFNLAESEIDAAFSQVERVRLLAKGDLIGERVPVANSDAPAVKLAAAEDLWAVVKKGEADKVQFAQEAPPVIFPPMSAGAVVGEVTAQVGDETLGRAKLAVPSSVHEAGWRWKLTRSVAPVE